LSPGRRTNRQTARCVKSIDLSGRSGRPPPSRATAHCGSFRLPLQRLAASPRRASTVTHARPGSRGFGVSFRGLWYRPGIALCGFERSPLAVRDGLGVFLGRPDSRYRSPGRSSRGVRFPFRAGPRLGCPCSGLAPAACAVETPRRARVSPLLGFLLPRALLRRVPRSPHHGLSTAAGRVRVAKPPPVPSSGFLPLSTVLAVLAARADPLRSSPFAVAPRRFAALFHAARAPGVALQSFPFSRSRTRSRGPLLPCGFAFDRPTARHGPGVSRPLSPPRRPLATAGPKAHRTGRLGRRFPGVARRRSWRVTALGCGVSSVIGRARRTRRPARPLRSFAPLESPFSRVIAALARVRSRGRCSPGLSSPLERSPADPWVRSSRGRTWSGRTRASCVLESSRPGHAFSPGLCSGRGV